MKKFLSILLKILEIIVCTPFALAGGIICGLFFPFLLLADVIGDILYN